MSILSRRNRKEPNLTEGLRKNDDGSVTMMVGPDAPHMGWEANYVRTLPGVAGSPA